VSPSKKESMESMKLLGLVSGDAGAMGVSNETSGARTADSAMAVLMVG
jgi:hypothetical protein